MNETVQFTDLEAGVLALNKTEFLGKDFILGGEVSDISAAVPVDGMSGFIMYFLPTLLVRFELEKEEDASSNDKPDSGNSSGYVRIVQSPYIPWKRLERNYQREIARLPIKAMDENVVKIDAKLFAGALSSEETGTFFSSSPVTFRKDLAAVDRDHVILPLEVAGDKSLFGSPSSILFAFHLKRWEPKETLQRTIHKNYGYFTLFEWAQGWEDVDPYKKRAKKYPEDPILAWDLVSHDQPIEYVLTESVPEEYRELFISAIESWNVAFRKAGYQKDVIRARVQKQNEKLLVGDPRYHLVYWERDPFRGVSGAHASFQVDPITGEMYHANVYFGGEKLVRALRESHRLHYASSEKQRESFRLFKRSGDGTAVEKDRAALVEQMNEILKPHSKFPKLMFGGIPFQKACHYTPDTTTARAADSVNDEDAFVRGWLREAMVHEVGHNWGLRHNFEASTGVNYISGQPSYSVMDYNDDRTVLEGLALKGPGLYDEQAIAYGYEKDLKPASLTLPFCTDDDLDFFDYDFNPHCSTFDSGANPLKDSLLPDLRRLYVKLHTTKDIDDQFRVLSNLQITLLLSSLYLTRNGTTEEKELLNAEVADLIDLTESDGKNLTSSWMYDLVRPLFVDWLLFVSSFFLESRDTLHASLLERAQKLIRADEAYAPNVSAADREMLLDDFVAFKYHSDRKIQELVGKSLLSLRDDLLNEETRLALQAGNAFRLADVRRFKALVENRLETFFGRKVGDRR